jgi:DNA modification methylase
VSVAPYFQADGITIYHGDAREILPQLRYDLVITSPPYFAQREYGPDPREIGRENDPRTYLHNLVECARLMAAGLWREGSMFVNLGDKMNVDGPVKVAKTPAGYPRARRQPRWPGMSQKSLMLLPDRFAIACIDELDLACRAEIVWWQDKGGSDGKAKDRERRAHERIFHFTRRLKHGERTFMDGKPGPSVWTISPQSRKVSHDADFPFGVPDMIVPRWCPPYKTVIDPFMGSGTVLICALKHGRRAIGIDLEERFCESAALAIEEWSGQLALAV